MASASASFDDSQAAGRSEFRVELCEIAREGGGKERAALWTGAIIASASPTRKVAAAIVAFSRVIERRSHPIAERDSAFASYPLAQAVGETRGRLLLYGLARVHLFQLAGSCSGFK
jgi:hypothetical protein